MSIVLIDAERRHKPHAPKYLRKLLKKAGINQCEAARLIGISDRTLRCYVRLDQTTDDPQTPYPVQVALEMLAADPPYESEST